jgi:hypothetical protein
MQLASCILPIFGRRKELQNQREKGEKFRFKKLVDKMMKKNERYLFIYLSFFYIDL